MVVQLLVIQPKQVIWTQQAGSNLPTTVVGTKNLHASKGVNYGIRTSTLGTYKVLSKASLSRTYKLCTVLFNLRTFGMLSVNSCAELALAKADKNTKG